MSSKLSFEINLDEDYDAISRLTIKRDKSRKVEKKTETVEHKKKVIPKKFIAHILELGFAAKDAARLYQSKNDWLGMRSGVEHARVGVVFTPQAQLYRGDRQ